MLEPRSGRPQIFDAYLGMRYVLYFATTPSGCRLPLVVVTAKAIPYQVQRRWQRWANKNHNSWVYYVVIEGIKAPSTTSTIAWLRKMASEEEESNLGWTFDHWVPTGDDGVHLVCDNLQGHKSKRTLDVYGEYKLTPHMMTPYYGRFTSPLDNGFNAHFRRLHHHYRSTPSWRTTCGPVGAIVMAYFEVPDHVVLNAYHAAGWHDRLYDTDGSGRFRRTSARSAKSVVRSFNNIGYLGTGKWEEVHDDAVHAFDHWASTRFRDLAEAVHDHTIIKMDDDLDGAKMNVYGRLPLDTMGTSYAK